MTHADIQHLIAVTTLVNVADGSDFDVWIGRGLKRARDSRMLVAHRLAAPYVRHDGDPNWREDALLEYRDFLVAALNDSDTEARESARKAMREAAGKRIGVSGEFGMEVGRVFIDVMRTNAELLWGVGC